MLWFTRCRPTPLGSVKSVVTFAAVSAMAGTASALRAMIARSYALDVVPPPKPCAPSSPAGSLNVVSRSPRRCPVAVASVANRSRSPPAFSASAYAASLAETTRSEVSASSSVQVLPSCMSIFIAGWLAARRLTWIGLAAGRCSSATRAVRILMVDAVRRGACSLLAATIAPVSPSTAR